VAGVRLKCGWSGAGKYGWELAGWVAGRGSKTGWILSTSSHGWLDFGWLAGSWRQKNRMYVIDPVNAIEGE